MQDNVTFEYAIIRVVPRVEREEFFNVGVILFSKRKKFLDVKFQVDQKKLEVFTSDIDLAMVQSHLEAWRSICEGHPHGGTIGAFEQSDRFRWLASCRSTIIQSSKTHSGLCNNPQKELDAIFETFVL